MIFIAPLITLVLGFSSASAQILVEDPQQPQSERPARQQPRETPSGEGAARKYFEERQSQPQKSSGFSTAASDRFMSVHIGGFIDDKQYRWGSKDHDKDVGGFIGGVSYRIGEWEKSMDLFFRAEIITFEVDDDDPVKLSIMPVVAFPDAASGFPLYFGAGAGLGVFFNQTGDESDLSIDYQLHTGLRFPELFETGGVIFELGYKGQVLLLSSGQFSGVYATVGGAFSF